MVTVCRSACDSGDQMMETKWASGSRDPFLNFRSADMSLEWTKLDFSNLVCAD